MKLDVERARDAFLPLAEALSTADHRPPTTDPERDKETRRQGDAANADLLVSPSPLLLVSQSSFVVVRRSPAGGEVVLRLADDGGSPSLAALGPDREPMAPRTAAD